MFEMGQGHVVAALALLACLAAPGLASAAQSFSVSSPSGGSSFPAGSASDYTTTMNFDSGAGAPQSAIVLATLFTRPVSRSGTIATR